MTHLLDDFSHNGHVVPLQPLNTRQKFVTTLRLPREHHYHQPPRGMLDRRQAIRPVQHYEMTDNLSPALALGCAAVGACALVLVAFGAFQFGRILLELIQKAIGGF